MEATENTIAAEPAASPTIGEQAPPARRWDPKGKRNLKIIGVVIFAAIALLFLLMTGRSNTKADGKVSSATKGNEQQLATGMLSETDRAALIAKEQMKIDEALRNGKSVAGTDINGSTVQLPDPALQTSVMPQSRVISGDPPPPAPVRLDQPPPKSTAEPAAPNDQKLMGVAGQMSTMMKMWGVRDGAEQKAPSSYVREGSQQAATTPPTAQAGPMGQSSQSSPQGTVAGQGRNSQDAVVIPAFEQAYAAELISSIDTDTTGKVRARVLTGPLAGAILTGLAKRSGDEGVQLEFTAGSFQSRSLRVSAYGVDMNTSGDVVKGKYDGRYMQRYVFPVLAEGVRAYAGARAQTGTQIIAINLPGATPTAGQQTPPPSAEQARNAMISAGAGQISQGLKSGPQDGHITLGAKTQFGVVFEQPIYQSDIPSPQR